MREFDLSDWEGLSEAFSGMFEGLGEVTATEGAISYSSSPPDVATGISITSDGGLVANMPLHGIDSRFDRAQIDESGSSIRLIGPSTDYTYRVPPQILARRKGLRGLGRLLRRR